MRSLKPTGKGSLPLDLTSTFPNPLLLPHLYISIHSHLSLLQGSYLSSYPKPSLAVPRRAKGGGVRRWKWMEMRMRMKL